MANDMYMSYYCFFLNNCCFGSKSEKFINKANYPVIMSIFFL